MKAERRHELQENQLAAWLAHKFVDVKPYVTTVIAVLAAVALAWFAWSWYSSTTATAQAETWNRYYKAVSESAGSDDTPLRDFIRDFPKEPAGIAAQERLAIILMGKGANSQLVSRDASRAAYQEAIENFVLVRDATDDESLKRFASLQIALAYESRYDLDEAVKEYEAVVKSWPDSAEAQRAANRIEDLKNPATRELYDWHRIVNPLATAPAASTTPVEPAKDLGNLPDAPPADATPPADPMPPADESPPADAAPETPAPGESTPPTDGKPAEDAPPAAAPSSDVPPADVPPADEKPAETPPPSDASAADKPADPQG